MPKRLVEKAINEYENKVCPIHHMLNSSIHHDGLYYQNMIYNLSLDFNVPVEIMKSRLRQLGYDYTDGTFITVDNCFYPPFTFPRGTLKDNETFVIDRDNYERLLREDYIFADLINSHIFVYSGYVVCLFDLRYVKPVFINGQISFVLTDYACEHAEECCYRFKKSSPSIDKCSIVYSNIPYLCKLEDLKMKIETSSEENGVLINGKQLKIIMDKMNEDKKKAEIKHAKMLINNVNTFSDVLKYH